MASQSSIDRLCAHSSATLHEAYGQRGAFPNAIRPVIRGRGVIGRAFTVFSPPLDNYMLHEAIYAAQPGDVLVVHVGGAYDGGYFGEVMTVAAMTQKLGGLIIDGCVRDSKEIGDTGFGVFSRGLCIRGTTKRGGGYVQRPLVLGDLTVNPGDVIVGDDDGIVAVAIDDVDTLLEAADQRVARETAMMARIRAGELRTIDSFKKGQPAVTGL